MYIRSAGEKKLALSALRHGSPRVVLHDDQKLAVGSRQGASRKRTKGIHDIALLRDHDRLSVRVGGGDAELDAAFTGNDGSENVLRVASVSFAMQPRRRHSIPIQRTL
jgi:hypothetical protein